MNVQLEEIRNMGAGEEMEEEHMTMSVVRQEITAQMNDLLDSVNHSIETKIRKRDSQISINKENICKLIRDSQSKDQEIAWLKEDRENMANKIVNLERRLENIEKRENRGGRDEVTNVARQPYIAADQPAIRKEDADLPSLPEPARPNAWANNWQTVGTKPKRRTCQQAAITSQHPANGKIGNTAPMAARQAKIESIVSKANRTVGLKPISRRRVQQFMGEESITKLPEKDQETEAKKLAVFDFIRHEMGMQEEKLEKLKIERVFYPRYGDNKVVYCQFSSVQDRAIITALAENLQPNEEYPSMMPKIVKYIPAELFNRYRALRDYTYQLRHNPTNPLATNIRFRKDDFELRIRQAKDHPDYDEDFKPDPWQYIQPTLLPDLPPIQLDQERKPMVKLSGRNLVPTPLPVPADILDSTMEDDIPSSAPLQAMPSAPPPPSAPPLPSASPLPPPPH